MTSWIEEKWANERRNRSMNEWNTCIDMNWNEWLDMNELEWVTWSEWTEMNEKTWMNEFLNDMNELTWASWMPELKGKNWHEWKWKILKWMHWNERHEVNELTWRNSMDMKELNDWVEKNHWHDWVEVNDWKWMKWNWWIEINDLIWVTWNQGLDMNEMPKVVWTPQFLQMLDDILSEIKLSPQSSQSTLYWKDSIRLLKFDSLLKYRFCWNISKTLLKWISIILLVYFNKDLVEIHIHFNKGLMEIHIHVN